MDRNKRNSRKPVRKPRVASRKPALPDGGPDALEALRARLAETEQALHAVRDGAVDALVVAGPQGKRVFTLNGAEQLYRRLVEEMSEGALVLSADATILCANRRISTMLDIPLTDLV